MNFEMPLVPDMETQKTRRIYVDIPNDTTQEEFWQFVALIGTTLFGYPDDLEDTSEWDIVGSFQEWGMEGKIGRRGSDE